MLKDLKIIFILAKNTFREMIRDRIFYIVISIAVLLIGFSVALGFLSFFEQFYITSHFSLMGIQLTSVSLCILIGCGLINREMEKKTILTVMIHSVDRWHFIIGKILGMIFVVTVILFLLSGVFFVVLWGLLKNLSFIKGFLLSFYGIFLESILIIAFSLLVSSFLRLFMAVISSVSFFLIGHFENTLHFFIEKSESFIFVFFAKLMVIVFPDLEKFNWRSVLVYKELPSLKEILQSSVYSFSYFILMTSLALLIFRKKDFD